MNGKPVSAAVADNIGKAETHNVADLQCTIV